MEGSTPNAASLPHQTKVQSTDRLYLPRQFHTDKNPRVDWWAKPRRGKSKPSKISVKGACRSNLPLLSGPLPLLSSSTITNRLSPAQNLFSKALRESVECDIATLVLFSLTSFLSRLKTFAKKIENHQKTTILQFSTPSENPPLLLLLLKTHPSCLRSPSHSSHLSIPESFTLAISL